MKKNIRIGVFFGYQPRVKLGTEGLGRYIANLIKGFVDTDNQVTIACPKWMLDSLFDIFEEFQIPEESVHFITSQRVPALWTLYEYFDARKQKVRRQKRKFFLVGCVGIAEWVVGLLLNITNLFLLGAVALLGFVIGILCLPAAILVFICYAFYRGIYALTHRNRFTIKDCFAHLKRLAERFSSSGTTFEEYILNRMTDNVIQELIRKINRSNEDIWFVPAIFWPQIREIKKVTVINAPDLVTYEFPQGFARYPGMEKSTKKCAETIENGKYFITYCEHLRRELVINQFGKPENHVVAIPHADNSMKKYVTFDANKDLPPIYRQKDGALFARSLLCGIGKYAPPDLQAYLRGFDFQHIQYIFYASQLRPSKNMFNLVRAYEYLLRRKNVKVKLFLTCDLRVNPEIRDYIYHNRLQNDIIPFYGVPAQLLAALYQCASLVVNPTLYEGGFPFTFGEGMSVGTPSVMGRIPQVTHVTDRYDVEEMLFDPYDYKDIAEKIAYALEHGEELYQKERPMYHQEFEIRTNVAVANEYIEAFQYFIELSRKEEELEKR